MSEWAEIKGNRAEAVICAAGGNAYVWKKEKSGRDKSEDSVGNIT